MPRKTIKTKYRVENELIETYAEVPEKQRDPWDANKKMTVVGKPMSRKDGYDKTTGSAKYTFDRILPNMLFAKTLRSPHAFAKITSIDVSKAEKVKGVHKIITHKNVPDIPWYWGTSKLFSTFLTYEGDEVACIAAESEAACDKAMELIDVRYEVLDHVIDPVKAMEEDAPKLSDAGNIVRGQPETRDRGDFDKAISEAEVVFEQTYKTQCEIHQPLEAHCSLVDWNGDELTVYDSTQSIWGVRDTVANSLGIPFNKVRVIKEYMGGGFGSKLEAGKYTVMAALLAKETGLPVKISLDRKEMSLAVGNRPDSTQTYKLGFKKNGTLTALHHHSVGAAGGYPQGAACYWPAATMYKCDNVKIENYSVLINAGRARAFRAPGHVQGTFALDSAMDEAAEKLGIDTLELMKLNFTDKDQTSGKPYSTKKLLEAYEQGAEAIGWKNRKKPGSGNGNLKRGIGVASQIWWGGGTPPTYAVMKMYDDGSVRVLCGTQDIGTGTYTILAQIAAEVLEIPVEQVLVTLGDTENCPYGIVSGGSLTTPSAGPAVRDAAENMKEQILSQAAAVLESDIANLTYKDAKVTDTTDESKTITAAELITKRRERMIISEGARSQSDEAYAYNTFGAQFADVEVDTLTGNVRVVKLVAAHDVGRVINPKTLNNQIHGGVMQGIGFALTEYRVMDEYTGKTLTTNLHTYKLPTIMDAPEIVPIIVSDTDPKVNIIGAKGVGEPPMIPTAGAIANAVYNAIGVRIREIPITPDKVLNALYG